MPSVIGGTNTTVSPHLGIGIGSIISTLISDFSRISIVLTLQVVSGLFSVPKQIPIPCYKL